MEACNTVNSCTDAGLACACCFLALTLLVAAAGAVFRLSAARSIVLLLRLTWRATYRNLVLRRTTG